MSKIGKKPIGCPSGLKIITQVKLPLIILQHISILQKKQMNLFIDGALGKGYFNLPSFYLKALNHLTLVWHIESLSLQKILLKLNQKELWGTLRSLLQNTVIGISQGFTKEVELNGLGFRVLHAPDNSLLFLLGYSHGIKYKVPADITVTCLTPTLISIFGLDKTLVGQVAAEIKKLHKLNPYKGKGIKYVNETIVLKEGKKRA